MISFNILSRWSRSVKFTAEIDCAEDAPRSIKVGLAVRWAAKTRVDLTDADLRGADLRGVDLRDADLRGAVLTGADLTDADLTGAALTDVDLTGADLRGAVLRGVDLRGADLTDADLTGAALRGADLTGVDLTGADLRGADLTGADLTDAVLTGADLTDADLTDADLTHADLTDELAIPDLDGQILAAIKHGGELDMGDWHRCETTHCRAGWAITIAGEAGAKLEKQIGPAAAGALIYAASYPDLRVPNFYANDEEAMADIKARAALAQAPVA